jgi:hypothetical protein
MKPYKLLFIFVILALILGPVLPAQASQPMAGNSPEEADAVPILVCAGTGLSGGDNAFLRGIRFTVSQSFNAVEVRMAGSSAGTYSFTAELRRSSGYITKPIATTNVVVNLVASGSSPMQIVRMEFGNISVSGTETFTLKFIDVRSVGTLYMEVFGIGVKPCANVEETDENDVAAPTERGDPAGFKVLAPNPDSLTVTSSFTSTPPTLDGVISSGEWDMSNKLPFDNGFLSFRNDGIRLYVLIDVLYDLHADDLGSGDYFYLTFDTNQNGVIDPNVDMNYGVTVNEHNLRYQYYLGANIWTGLQPSTRSARARGFGCFAADGSFSLASFKPIKLNCTKHRVWELAIDLDEIQAVAGETLKMGVKVASATPAYINELPENFTEDFSDLISVVTAPVVFLAPDPDYTITLDTDAIEITQAIQDRDNTLALVEDKTTVARVYVDVNNAAIGQGVTAFLYGSRNGVDLPGSPLMKFYNAPTSINRTELNHTANFALPVSWDEGTVTFSSRARSLHEQEVSSTPFNLTFSEREVPVYWYVPINTGTNNTPNLISNTEMDSQRSYLEAIYPVPSVTWVQKPWTVIGPTTIGNTIADLNDYYNSVALAWLLTVIFTGKEPFALPDQIYGFVPSGGGLSDPTWIGANGRVGYGFRGTSREGTLAHEINHNLDRSSDGTWGRHIPFGCGASGTDPSWPYANDDIQEVGFDTRLPWVDNAAQTNVIPGTTPDIMSYCQSGILPTKWISPYRWTNLFNNFAPSGVSALSAAAVATNVYYLSGAIQEDGTGSLNPAFIQLGEPSIPENEGNAEIQLLGPKGELVGNLIFNIDFLDDPEEPFSTSFFNLRIPVPETAVSRIVLVYKDQVVDEILVSSNAPTITVNSPSVNGQSLSEVGALAAGSLVTLSWTASDLDNDPLSFTILYSPDNGANWYPVASNITGSSYDIDTSVLPGGDGGIFRVIVTDGANTSEDDNDTPVVLPDNSPVVLISGAHQVPNGTVVSLSGDAYDAEDGDLPEEQYAWSEGDTALGYGKTLDVLLDLGIHSITLTVSDSNENTTSVNYMVIVGNTLYLPTTTR